MNDIKGMIFDVQRNSFVDGPGIRTTVFFKECNLRCVWCHNPESHSRKPQQMLLKNEEKKTCGKEYTPDEILAEIVKDKSFFRNSGGGVTFSGGECMLQIDFLEEILKKCKEHQIHTAIDTAGCVPRSYFERIIPYTDMFLYDIKAFDEDVHIKHTGMSNKLILDNLIFLATSGKEIEIRIPYVPKYNDGEMEKIAEFLNGLKSIMGVRILPYHNYASSKYPAIGMKNTLPELLPTDEEIQKAK